LRLTPQINAFNVDCMEFMKDKPDNFYDLAIVDPPYGIGIVDAIKKSAGTSSMFKMSKGGEGENFDNNIPPKEYFEMLVRVSYNQIIWGGNYFLDYLGNTSGFAVWDKMNGTNPMADVELAWTSFSKSSKMFRMHHFSSGYGEKIHPTQKPIKLYRWLLKNYTEEGDKILDTHGGSFSSAIACHKEGFDLDICELDEDYFNDAVNRFKLNTCQKELEFARPD
jgi:site-specific DNA-methyltransferase (adenine-specific)